MLLVRLVDWCMIKIFQAGRSGDTLKTPSPYEQLLPLPTPCFKMFLERSLNDPTTPLQATFTATPSPSTTLSPPKNFDHTPGLWSVWCDMVTNKSDIGKEEVSEELHSTDSVFYVYDDIDELEENLLFHQ